MLWFIPSRASNDFFSFLSGLPGALQYGSNQEIHQLPESEQDLADLVKVIRYSVEKYITEDKDRLTSKFCLAFNIPPQAWTITKSSLSQ